MNEKSKLWKWAENRIPPGTHIKKIRDILLSGTILSAAQFFACCILYIGETRTMLGNISRNAYGNEYLLRAHLISINECLQYLLLTLLITSLILLSLILTNYMYFHKESKSAYIMARVKDRWELHKRCCAMPLLGAWICAILAAVFYGVFILIYFHFAPEGYIPEQTIAFFWRYVP